jgi:serine/threonine-protein kinase HipA
MPDIEVHIDFAGGSHRVGTLHLIEGRRGQGVSFEYEAGWRDADFGFSLEPALQLGPNRFYPQPDRAIFGSLGDSAPDTWGRSLMQKAERRRARAEARAPRTLQETDYLLGVTDAARLGAMRFRWPGNDEYQAPLQAGVPGFIRLGDLLAATERTLRDEETDEDLLMIFAPGSSLGGARPKASVIDQQGSLSIAKFPKETDTYRVELWESVALILARNAGIRTPDHQLAQVDGRPIMISKRFDRVGDIRVPFLSALSMLELTDGTRSSYPELVDVLARNGANAREDAHQLYRRMVLNILISNVDDHLRNHGFLLSGGRGWTLSPAYDLNPVPTDLKARVLTTAIDGEDGTCDIDLALDVSAYFNLRPAEAREIIKAVADAVSLWSDVAARQGATAREVDRMSSAFEHQDLQKGLRF